MIQIGNTSVPSLTAIKPTGNPVACATTSNMYALLLFFTNLFSFTIVIGTPSGLAHTA